MRRLDMEEMGERKKLQVAKKIIMDIYDEKIKSIILHETRPVLKIVFHNETILNIRYNDYGEYSYTTIFSPKPNDQMRFDNYDDQWDVTTKPHHFHLKGLKEVQDSPMNGNPKHDIELLQKYLEI